MSTATTGKLKITPREIIKMSSLCRLFLDLLILTSLCALSRNLPLFLRQATGSNGTIAEVTTKVGFFCNDYSLKYPYKEDTIPERRLYQIGLQLPLAMIFIVELLHFLKHSTNSIDFLLQLYAPLGRFIFGYAAERILKAIANHFFLRPRPTFFEVCQPHEIDGDDGENMCAALYDSSEYHEYVANYACSYETPQLLHKVFTAFYSGHASLVCYGMTFVVVYLQQRYVWHRTKYLQHVLQLICLLVAWCVSLSRIWDYMHHATGVLFGALLGATIAVISVHFVDRNCKKAAVVADKSTPTRTGTAV